MPAAYSGRSEALRLHGAFAATSTAWDQFVVFSKDAVPEVQAAIEFVERVFGCDAAARQFSAHQLREKGLANGSVSVPTVMPQLLCCRKLLAKFMTTLDEDDDERLADAQVRVEVPVLPVWSLEEYLATLPVREQEEEKEESGDSGSEDDKMGDVVVEERSAMVEELIEELAMAPATEPFEFPPPPDEVLEEIGEDNNANEPASTPLTHHHQPLSEEPAPVDSSFAEDHIAVRKEIRISDEPAALMPMTARALAPAVRNPALVYLERLQKRVADAPVFGATGSGKAIEVTVKKPFSVAAIKPEKEKKKEKKDKKIDKEKKRLSKLMQKDGVVANESEQKQLAAAATRDRSSSGGGGSGSKDTLRAVDTVPLMFVRIVMGKAKRNSNFVLSAEPAASEDVMRLPYDAEAVQPSAAVIDGRIKGLPKHPLRVFAEELLNDAALLHKAFSTAFWNRAPTFTGRECVDWFVSECGVSREDGVYLGQKLLRCKCIFAVGDNFEVEDDLVVRFKLMNSPSDQIEVYLMGSGGAFGPELNVPLAMLMFSSAADLCKEKVITLRNGRHSFELRASIVDEKLDQGKVDLPSSEEHVSGAITAVLRHRQDLFDHVLSILATLDNPLPDLLGSSPQMQMRALAEAECGLNLLCSLILDESFKPFEFSSSQGCNLLHLVCLAGNAAAAALLVKSCPLYSSRSNGPTALHYAILGGSRECVSLVVNSVENALQRAALLSSVWAVKFLPLHLAVSVGQTECAAELIALGASLVQKDCFGSCALSAAAFSGSLQCVKLLLQHGAEPEAVDDGGNSALMIAIARGFSEIVQCLLVAKRSMAVIRNNSGDSPLWIALASSNAEAVELLVRILSRDDLNAPIESRHRNTLLHRAVLFLPDGALRELLPGLSSAETLLQLPNAEKLTPLHMAIATGKVGAASTLLALLPNRETADETDGCGNSPLHLAVTARAVDWVFTNCRPKLEARNTLFYTPVMTCCAVGSREAISATLGNDCDPTEVNSATRKSAIEYLEARESSRLVLSFSERDAEETALFRIRLPSTKEQGSGSGSLPGTPSTFRKKNLTQGLSRRGSKQLKEGGGEIVISLGKARF